jgi:hypothetical protein
MRWKPQRLPYPYTSLRQTLGHQHCVHDGFQKSKHTKTQKSWGKASAPSPPKKYKNKTKNGGKPSKMSRKKILGIRSWETEESAEKSTGKRAKNEKIKRRRHGTCVSQRTTTAMGFDLVHVAQLCEAKPDCIGYFPGINSVTCPHRFYRLSPLAQLGWCGIWNQRVKLWFVIYPPVPKRPLVLSSAGRVYTIYQWFFPTNSVLFPTKKPWRNFRKCLFIQNSCFFGGK